jgi:hypothetical protein
MATTARGNSVRDFEKATGGKAVEFPGGSSLTVFEGAGFDCPILESPPASKFTPWKFPPLNILDFRGETLLTSFFVERALIVGYATRPRKADEKREYIWTLPVFT